MSDKENVDHDITKYDNRRAACEKSYNIFMVDLSRPPCYGHNNKIYVIDRPAIKFSWLNSDIAYYSWGRPGFFYFHQKNVKDSFNELIEWAQKLFMLTDPNILYRCFEGCFDNENCDDKTLTESEIFNTLCKLSELKHDLDRQQIVIYHMAKAAYNRSRPHHQWLIEEYTECEKNENTD